MKKIILIFMVLVVSLHAGFKFEKYPHYFNSGITIKSIKDGDTFDIKYLKATIAIRLYGIDTLEINKSKSSLEKEYGEMAKEFLSNQLNNKNIYITVLKKGQYGRQDAIVEIGQGSNNKKINVNEELLKEGLAIVAEKYCRTNELDKYLKLQTEASNNQKGFWANTNFYPEIINKIEYYQNKK